MSECCKQGSFHKGTAVGSETKLADRDVYVTGDESSSVAILLVPDIFGWRLNNTRCLADKYAKGVGARVYVPDFFDGEAVPTEVMSDPKLREKFDIMAFLGKYHPREASWPKVEAVVEAIRSTQKGVKKVGAIGFCWGAPSCLYLGSTRAKKSAHVDAIGFAHPSVSETSDFEHLDAPSLFLCAEHDEMLPDDKRNAAIDVTKKLTKEKGTFVKWVYYPNTTHGFATRGDEEDGYVARCMQDAANEAISHFRASLLA
ncbi:uncharacterized protein PFL1_04193 [Pseudozyma flocculosa PF-1]|uniref:Related to hydrolase related to dienelactone hydrolase n=2 Tax=Pseudozyma flocculosa TaxID=84751 RepID=A0A5C3EUI1_9BASI|nr:uncharacterized protein PFL1_04193 [Pseudozyma flocculosa PF-1]EPQ28366.1 hypothetical protein PFL1_04193 [Pseudozyma flocculosa PF-1]SPO35520.1 related to hydrolase related to dienelactone hydrolase [Pseudozyma flocculosa]